MEIALPQLDVYYIEFLDPAKVATLKKYSLKTPVANANVVAQLAPLLFPGVLRPIAILPGIGLYHLVLYLGLSFTRDMAKALKRLYTDGRFNIIESPERLQQFENAYGNEWFINRKALKRKQYYIRHPKKLSRNILIEAQSFYKYVEQQQTEELLNYIKSHCSAKRIQIERTEVANVHGNAKANVRGADAYGGLNYKKSKDYFLNLHDPNGFPHMAPMENYFWLDKSIMLSIDALGEGASMTQTYECDFTFGLTAGEAKTIGLDMSRYKKYSYSIHIEC